MAWKYGYIDSKGTFIPVDVQDNKFAQISDRAEPVFYKPVFYNDETKQYFEYSQVLDNDVRGDVEVRSIIDFLTKGNTNYLSSEGMKYVDYFIKENGGKDAWANYYPPEGFSGAQKKHIKTTAPVISSETAWKYGYIDSKGTFIPVDVEENADAQISNKAKPVFYNVESNQYFEYSQVLGNDVGGDANSKRTGVRAIQYFLTKGTTEGLTSEGRGYVNNFIKENGGANTWAKYDPTAGFSEVQKKYIQTTAPVISSETAQANAKEDAFNDYYKDLYSLKEGSQGKEMYDRLTRTYLNEADAQYNLADASYQQMAMQQAQVVKQITDKVRGERMARLRAGMSESQIANQDMQMMMANVDALNQQAYAMQQQKLEAQTNRGLAQDKAYNDYLAQTAQKGQTAAALYASDVANPTMQTLQKLWQLYPNGGWTTEDYNRVSNEVIGNVTPKQ